MRFTIAALLALVIGFAVYLPTAAAPAAPKPKKYQVTGKVLEVTDTKVTVQKGDEKWELDRNADTKNGADLTVGAKVTISYHMVADSVELKKADAGADEPKEEKPKEDKPKEEKPAM